MHAHVPLEADGEIRLELDVDDAPAQPPRQARDGRRHELLVGLHHHELGVWPVLRLEARAELLVELLALLHGGDHDGGPAIRGLPPELVDLLHDVLAPRALEELFLQLRPGRGRLRQGLPRGRPAEQPRGRPAQGVLDTEADVVEPLERLGRGAPQLRGRLEGEVEADAEEVEELVVAARGHHAWDLVSDAPVLYVLQEVAAGALASEAAVDDQVVHADLRLPLVLAGKDEAHKRAAHGHNGEPRVALLERLVEPDQHVDAEHVAREGAQLSRKWALRADFLIVDERLLECIKRRRTGKLLRRRLRRHFCGHWWLLLPALCSGRRRHGRGLAPKARAGAWGGSTVCPDGRFVCTGLLCPVCDDVLAPGVLALCLKLRHQGLSIRS
mmetsp:Transcript_47883/g.138509  ORF Transcript_47883/g.138509 Transcript_47883/m.138509 type:complete len:385 (+) Transcript_47883:936-2090(+)